MLPLQSLQTKKTLQLLNFWSCFKSTQVDMPAVKSSQIKRECDQVDGSRLGVILASSLVTRLVWSRFAGLSHCIN